ncbi:TPA: hypothetical protein EYP70_00005 [Candidatus Bathyarchaeota archaeon]|nr:hypothetical protein [Candidatus Bathyarchaeota archaeon]
MGGYLHFLARDGTVFGTDKAMWIQCRETWIFSKLYNTIKQKSEWLKESKIGYDYITAHGFDSGRMFFQVTREGLPLRKRRYFFTECFEVMACIEYYLNNAGKPPIYVGGGWRS